MRLFKYALIGMISFSVLPALAAAQNDSSVKNSVRIRTETHGESANVRIKIYEVVNGSVKTDIDIATTTQGVLEINVPQSELHSIDSSADFEIAPVTNQVETFKKTPQRVQDQFSADSGASESDVYSNQSEVEQFQAEEAIETAQVAESVEPRSQTVKKDSFFVALFKKIINAFKFFV